MDETIKKTIYKKWWFWTLFAAVLIISITTVIVAVTCSSNVKRIKLDVNSKSLKIGETFKLIATVETSDDKTDKTVIWSSNNSSVAYVTDDGTVKANGAGTAKIFAVSKIEPRKKAACIITVIDSSYKQAGIYKAGTDIESGEYLLIADLQDNNILSMGYYQLTTTAQASPDSPEFLYSDNFFFRSYISVKDGQYLSFVKCKLFKIKDYPPVDKNAESWHSGQYKVGVDLSEGEYILTALPGILDKGYIEITKTPDANITSVDFISNDNFENYRYITLLEGTYIKFNRAVLTKVKN